MDDERRGSRHPRTVVDEALRGRASLSWSSMPMRHLTVTGIAHRRAASPRRSRATSSGSAIRQAPKRPVLHAVGRAADVEVDLVVAERLRRSRAASASFAGSEPPSCSATGCSLGVEAEQPLAIAMEHRVGRHHLGVEQRAPRQQAMEEPAMPVRPIHHGRDTESMVQGHYRISFRPHGHRRDMLDANVRAPRPIAKPNAGRNSISTRTACVQTGGRSILPQRRSSVPRTDRQFRLASLMPARGQALPLYGRLVAQGSPRAGGRAGIALDTAAIEGRQNAQQLQSIADQNPRCGRRRCRAFCTHTSATRPDASGCGRSDRARERSTLRVRGVR